LRQTRSGARNAHASRSDDLSFARYQGRSLAADERLRPFLRDSGKREESKVYALDRSDASVFTTGNDLPVNRQTLFGCQMYYMSILFGRTKSGKIRAARVNIFPPYSEHGALLAAFFMLEGQRLLAAAIGTRFPA
jgi:hypothetical protein